MNNKSIRLQNGIVLKFSSLTPLTLPSTSKRSCSDSAVATVVPEASNKKIPNQVQASNMHFITEDVPIIESPKLKSTIQNVQENAKEDWTEESTKAMLDLYYDSLPKVGPMKVFKTKKHMWEYIATKVAKITGVTKTWEQCSTRYKTVLRRKNGISVHNKRTGESPKKSEYDAEFKKIASIDDTLIPEVLMSGSTAIVNKKNEIENRKRKTKSDILLQIHREREENKKKRHEEKMAFINTLKNDFLKMFENK